jgi:hypothetical protein
MLILILQQFVERILRDPRLLQPAVYTELGQLIEACCRASGPKRLPVEIKRIVETLLRIEVASNSSRLTYDGCAALLERMYARSLYREDRFELLALDFLNAAAARWTNVHSGAHATPTSVLGGRAKDICPCQVFLSLTHSGHSARQVSNNSRQRTRALIRQLKFRPPETRSHNRRQAVPRGLYSDLASARGTAEGSRRG